VPSIIVSDRAAGPPPAGLASTVITVGDAERDAPTPDLSFTQISASTVRISTSAFTTDVQIATFKAEQPFLGGAAGQTA
jgi:hypothetical protein